MTTCAIMQPTYLPWVGYFSLMKRVDQFVFLDDVQLSKQSWQTRNRILVSGESHWLSVQISKPSGLTSLIKDVFLDDRISWRKKHVASLQANYGRHPYYKELLFIEETLLNANIVYLADLNVQLIMGICKYLGLTTNIHLASKLNIVGSRSERLYLISTSLGCDRYMSPMGSQEYLIEDNFEEKYPINLEYFNHLPREYTQRKTSVFVPYLSIYDLLANHGKESIDYI